MHPDDFVRTLPKRTLILDVYMMDHGGVSISTRCDHYQAVDPAHRILNGRPGGWDWGRLGIIYATPKKIREWYGVGRATEEVRDRAAACLESEIKLYDLYLRGETYGFVVEEVKGDDVVEIDSCWGFIGADVDENGINDHLPKELHAAAREAMRTPEYA
jgi:hypothetical protein